MTNKNRKNEFKKLIADITTNRRKTKEAIKETQRYINANWKTLSWGDSSKIRMDIVRSDFYCTREVARSTMLAYGYLRGRAYKEIEASCKEEPSSYLIADIAEVSQSEIASWLEVSDV